jgi:hypothetical protein
MIAMLGGILPNLVVVASIAGLAIYGWRQGLFLATVAGLQVLTSFLVGMACVPEVAAFVSTWGVPGHQGLATAFLLVFGLGILAVRLAIGAGVPHDAIPFAPIVDTVGGGLVGAMAGLVLGGALLIGWSMAALPDQARLDAAGLSFDAGSKMLAAFARCVLPAGTARGVLLDGEASDSATGEGPRCSEPFVDANRNAAFDAGERYLDLDRDGRFTRQRPFVDENSNQRRDFGLRECYRLAAWQDLVVLHTPRLTSPVHVDMKRQDDIDDTLYQASAADDDPGDTLKFALVKDAKDDATDLEIDAATGRVSVLEFPDPNVRKTYRFTVMVTDRHGLTATQAVSVSVSSKRR